MCIDSNYEMFGTTNSHDIDLSSAASQGYDGYGSFFTLEWRWSAHPQWEYMDGANLPGLYVEGLQISYKSQKQHAHCKLHEPYIGTELHTTPVHNSLPNFPLQLHNQGMRKSWCLLLLIRCKSMHWKHCRCSRSVSSFHLSYTEDSDSDCSEIMSS
jgi:hypothetical protein